MTHRAKLLLSLIALVAALASAGAAQAAVRVTFERNQKQAETPEFRFHRVPAMSDTDAGQDATVDVLDGKPDWGCDARQLNDGAGPVTRDDAPRCFRFGQDTSAGRIRFDLGSIKPVAQVNTYSWNGGSRAPQVYTLYGSDGASPKFAPAPPAGTEPDTVGWTKIASVDTRPPGFLKSDGGGGQYGVSVADDAAAKPIGSYRYLLWDIAATSQQAWDSTCYAEFDVVVTGTPPPSKPVVVKTRDGRTIEGVGRFENDKLVVKGEDDDEAKSLSLGQVDSATFRDNPAGVSDADDGPSAGGLKAEYFDDQAFRKPKLIRYDPVIDFRWGLGPPDPSVNVDFSARWTGQVEPRYSETYTFYTHADDGVRVWVDGKPIIDQWFDRPPFDQKGTIELQGGKKYDLRVEFHDQMAEASIQLMWSSPSQPKQVVPASRLSPPPDDPAAAPRVAMVTPKPDRWRLAPPSIDLEATVIGGAKTSAGTSRVEFFTGNVLLGTATTRPYQYTWVRVPPGHHKLTAKATDAAGTVASSPPVIVDVAGNGGGSLPSPWGTIRLGATDRSDNCAYSGGLFTIRAAGGELRAATDSGYFVAQPLDGDGQVTARIGDLVSDAAPNAVAGVMIRETLAGDARSVAVLAGKESAEYLRRWEPGSWVAASDLSRNVPCYVRLVRTGDNFKAYLSDNGSSWQLVGSDQLPMGPQSYVGLIATSRADDGTCQVTADHVRVQAGSVPMDATTTGVRTVGGSFLAGEVRRGEDGQVIVVRNRGGDVTLAPDAVARIALHPLPTELATGVGRGRSGVLLSTGDFFDGDLKSLADGQVVIDSVLFGEKAFDANQVLAVILHDTADEHHAEVRTRDGSSYATKSARIEGGRLLLDADAAGATSLSLRDVVEIRN